MAAEQQQIPTFKLVLVGDGGTGKVRQLPCGMMALMLMGARGDTAIGVAAADALHHTSPY
jgi:hypothetical protein